MWDILHHHCHDPDAIPDREALELALATWPEDVLPKIHFSSPRTAVETGAKGKIALPPLRAHADLVDPIAFEQFLATTAAGLDFDVLLEAKAKDLALLRLREQLAARGYAPGGVRDPSMGRLTPSAIGETKGESNETEALMSTTIEQSIEVEVPVQSAYNQWTQFEEFPKFMEGVEEIRQIDDKHLHWVAEFGGTRHEWDAEITEQLPDERVAWRNTDGKDNAGVVTFHKLSDTRSKVMVQMDFVPEGIKEKIGSAIGAPDRRVKGDLERFKDLIESRGSESGSWRGEVPRDA